MTPGRRVAVVTGAAAGIGRAIAQALSVDFQVVGIDARSAPSETPLLLADVTNRRDIEKAAAEIDRTFGTVAVLVNNAGLLTMNPFLQLTDEEWRTVFDVNVYGVYVASQVFGRAMAKAKQGRVINIASIAGKVPLPNQAHYSASKAAVIMLTKSIGLELAPVGIRAFAVCPGAVDTEMFETCLQWTAEREERDVEELRHEWLAPSRLGRMIQPEEVAEIVHYLAVGPTDAMTGHALSVDGGVAPY